MLAHVANHNQTSNNWPGSAKKSSRSRVYPLGELILIVELSLLVRIVTREVLLTCFREVCLKLRLYKQSLKVFRLFCLVELCHSSN